MTQLTFRLRYPEPASLRLSHNPPIRAVASGSDVTLPASVSVKYRHDNITQTQDFTEDGINVSVCVCSQLRQHPTIARGMARGVQIGSQYLTQTCNL